LQIYFIFARIFERFRKFQKHSQKERAKESAKKKGADVNEGKFVLNIDFIIALKPDGLWAFAYMKLNKTAYNFNVLLY
jgi:hypothetical protein